MTSDDDRRAKFAISQVRAVGEGAPIAARAFAYASVMHSNDRRKATDIPYIAHLSAVAALLWEHGGDDEQAAAGLLHDVAEDHGGQARLDEIADLFGEGVARIVADCSDTLTSDEPKAEWRARKEAYIAGLATKPERSLLVSGADKVHNATCIVDDARADFDRLWGRFTCTIRASTSGTTAASARSSAVGSQALGAFASQCGWRSRWTSLPPSLRDTPPWPRADPSAEAGAVVVTSYRECNGR